MIYMDSAATTPLANEAYKKMIPFFVDFYANASENYDFASKARSAVNESRKHISRVIGSDITEVYYTSGGTESDNLALLGAAYSHGLPGHIITTAIEHHAVLNSCRYLEENGFDVTYIKPQKNGIVDTAAIENAIREDTFLISVMAANNEIGTIQPLKEIGLIARKHGILFHTDAVAAFAHIPIDVNEMNIDLLSASAHKCNGPKGVGMLYIRDGVRIKPILYGGKQERGIRPGTENVAGIAGFGEACRLALEKDNYNADYIRSLSASFVERIMNSRCDVILNGDIDNRLPGNINLSFKGVKGEALQIELDRRGICASTGSACNAGTSEVSHVISSIDVPDEYAIGTVRFSISDLNTYEEISYAADTLIDILTSYNA